MTAHKRCTWLAAGLLLCTAATVAQGQSAFLVDSPSHDLQFFSPTEFDFDFRPVRRDSGYFFTYDKLSWATVGEHTVVGDNAVTVLSENIYPGNAGDMGSPPPQYQIINGLQEVPPDAEFAWGERYEFGFFGGSSDSSAGWMIGILDGPTATAQVTFGFGPSLNGFGSVHVNFATPPGYLLGFRNYENQTINGADFVIGQNPVVGGPGTPGSDGMPDGINGDAIPVFYFFGIDADASGEIDDDEVTGNGVDFGDLHLFNIRFDTLLVRNVTETQGVEIMRTHELSNRHLLESKRRNRWEIAYGVRFLRIRDSFFFQGTGDLLGLTQVETGAENQIVGPQIRSKWSTQRGRLNVEIDGRFVFGYNVQDLDQTGDIGQNLIPGGLNSFIQGQPTTFAYGRQANDFAPLVELRADASYQLTSSIAARLGYTAIFVDNITRASQVVRYALPDMGILPAGNQNIFINGVNFGFDVVY